MEKPKFEFYTRPNGHNEFLEFLESLTESDSDKMFSLIHKIQDSGLLVAQYMQWVKKVDKIYMKSVLNVLIVFKGHYTFM